MPAASVFASEGPLLDPPAGDDYTCQSPGDYQQRLLEHWGGYREIPLDLKAEYFEWQAWRYHRTDFHQVYNRVHIPRQPGVRPESIPTGDSSTWNGALLAALSYKYAVTREAETLRRIAELLRGLHLFFEVTQMPGLMARAIHPDKPPEGFAEEPIPYTAADGRQFYYFGDPAKGGYNQLAGGYAAMMMHAYRDLPPEIQQMAQADVTNMVLHLVDHDYKATDRNGRPATHGNLTPLVSSSGVPFNAQVAYQIVALGYCFPPDDPRQLARIAEQFVRLRGRHHVYYEHPLRSLVLPQRVAASPFVKGMNDRNHVMNAAYVGIALEVFQARGQRRALDRTFVYQLGQTLVLGMRYLDGKRNALCNFMWAGLLADPQVFDCMIDHKPNTARAIADRGVTDGVEQLRRFQLDRWAVGGHHEETEDVQWCDAHGPDDYHWKVNPYAVFRPTGPPGDAAYCAIDYLYAYWLFRYYRLDEHSAITPLNLAVLKPTPSLSTAAVDESPAKGH